MWLQIRTGRLGWVCPRRQKECAQKQARSCVHVMVVLLEATEHEEHEDRLGQEAVKGMHM